VEWAAHTAQTLLADTGDRWAHVRGVAEKAERVRAVLSTLDGNDLVTAAWLHDIGYSPRVRSSGVHQLDGAAYLQRYGCDQRIVNLVAHHSQAHFEVEICGRASELERYAREESATVDALSYCDLTTSPTGDATSVEERLREVEARYGEGDIVTALRRAKPHLLGEVHRTECLLRQCGIPG
jgi:putative nucleotidyltransferase with HDIG domain